MKDAQKITVKNTKGTVIGSICKTAKLFNSLGLKEYEDYFRVAELFYQEKAPFSDNISYKSSTKMCKNYRFKIG